MLNMQKYVTLYHYGPRYKTKCITGTIYQCGSQPES